MNINLRIPVLLIVLTLCINMKSLSQDGSLAHVAAGASIPTGDFSNNDFNNPSSGFAQVGFNLNLQYAYKFNDYVGIGAMVTGDVHGYDYNAVKEGLQEGFETVFPDIDEIYVSTFQWVSGGVLAGGVASLPFNNRLALDVKAMAGFLYIHSPELKIEVVSTTNPGFLIIENDRAVSFAWDLGAGLRYNIRGNKYLCLQYDYIGARPYFKDQKTYLIVDDVETESSDSYSQDVKVMNITVGIGYIID